MSKLFQILLFLFYLFHLLCLSSSIQHKNSSSTLCHHYDKKALLEFKNVISIDVQFTEVYYDVPIGSSYPKTLSWKEDTDCCSWDGVTCDSMSGHVIGLDLSCSQLGGIIHPVNTTLFHLSHLQTLNLAYNNFFPSRISPKLAHFWGLKLLNLSHSGFVGEVPMEISYLKQLVLLDLTIPSIVGSDANTISEVQVPYSFSQLEFPHFDRMIKNLTNLSYLRLNGVLINSAIPQNLANLSYLTSLELCYCNLQGKFPSNILRLPLLHSLMVDWNPNLYVDSSKLNNLTSSLKVVDFSGINLSSKLPQYQLGSKPTQLRQFAVSSCNVLGTVPLWVWNTTEVVLLANNFFTGNLPLALNKTKLSQLTNLDLSGNLLTGTIPSWLFTLPLLTWLDIGSNRFTGKLDWSFLTGGISSLEILRFGGNSLSLELNVLSNFNNLLSLDVSNTALSFNQGETATFLWPKLSFLFMSFCNLTEFPDFSSSQESLVVLDISNNKIQGEIPTWFYKMGEDSLSYLNLSHNNLVGGLHLVSWKNLDQIDVRYNFFEGFLPLPPPSTTLFLASNNRFSKGITSSFCNLTKLVYLDLSYNNLNIKLPNCFGKFSSLEALYLESNMLHGVIPIEFTMDCTLKSIHLDNNHLEGKIPRSLKRCKHLQVLDLGKNQFNDSFPYWLDDLPGLKVLVLQSNNFHGSIKDNPKDNKHPFPKLQILDLSNNQFSGKLPSRYLEKFEAMMMMKNNGSSQHNNKRRTYIGDYYYFQDSLVLTEKGLQLTYKILTILTALDFSNNSFTGGISDSIGQLVALIFLNVSHNYLTGNIPPSLANLTLLESLDLSWNKLQGKIPPELAKLTFLEDFNVSENQLVGPIPQGPQFSTFSTSSYARNHGLCGDPMPECAKGEEALHHQPTLSKQKGFDVTNISLLKVILVGFGVGAILGLVAGYYMLVTRSPIWFIRKADKMEYIMVKRWKKHCRNKQRRRFRYY